MALGDAAGLQQVAVDKIIGEVVGFPVQFVDLAHFAQPIEKYGAHPLVDGGVLVEHTVVLGVVVLLAAHVVPNVLSVCPGEGRQGGAPTPGRYD